ncbi:unnamed protein product [Merluccius merluccius]
MDPSRRSSFTVSVLVAMLVFVAMGRTDGSTTPSRKLPCTAQTTCDTCIQYSMCLWCYTNNTCTEYPVSHLLPWSSECALSQARWGLCWVNFEALIIAMAMLVGGILIAITVCCCWCCCRRRRQSRPDRDEERFAKRREEIRQRSEERAGERKTRHEDIRKKYGLIADSDPPYNKFENE